MATLADFIKAGKELEYTGKDLEQNADQKFREAKDAERDERARERQHQKEIVELAEITTQKQIEQDKEIKPLYPSLSSTDGTGIPG